MALLPIHFHECINLRWVMAPSFVIKHTPRTFFFSTFAFASHILIVWKHLHHNYLNALVMTTWGKKWCCDPHCKTCISNISSILSFFFFVSTTMVTIPLSLNDLASWAMCTFLFFFVHFVREQKTRWMCTCASMVRFFVFIIDLWVMSK